MLINPGLLKHKISILRYEEMLDSEGFRVKDYKKILGCRAYLKKNKSKDDHIGKSSTKTYDIESSTPTLECVIRYNKNVTDKDYVQYEDKIYSISEIEDIDFEKRFLRVVLKNE